ncbi:HNH endonuclease [Yersinia enterocolitica]|uniref:HNH endonuclease n=1 Tax=Yersinia enterocolitica TaxID=630 RepID=UPI0038BAE641|nr:HNH endonuclease [Yersinia enterocolitica]
MAKKKARMTGLINLVVSENGQKRKALLMGKTANIMRELGIEPNKYLGNIVQGLIIECLRNGESEPSVLFQMQRHPKVGEYRTRKVKDDLEYERARPLRDAAKTQRIASTKLIKKRPKIDEWEEAKRRMPSPEPRSLNFGHVGLMTVAPEKYIEKPLAGVNTPAVKHKTFDFHTSVQREKGMERPDLLQVTEKRIRPALRRDFAFFVVKHRLGKLTANELANEFLKTQVDYTPAQDIKDPVIVIKPNGEHKEFHSTSKAFTNLGIGKDNQARKFRLGVKVKGADIWTHNGEDYLVKLKYPRIGQLSNSPDAQDQPLKPKRKGTATVTTRPDQSEFSQWVEANCNGTCVVTGAKIHVRGSAAHLLENSNDGIDHYTNGLWLRWDIHKLFDDDLCSIDPATLKIWFLDVVMYEDKDLRLYNGRDLGPINRPINRDFLTARWSRFCALRDLSKE